MIKKIENYLQKYLPNINQEHLTLFCTILKHKYISKNEIIIEQGKPTRKFYILEKGVVGSFVVNHDNHEFMRTLYNEEMVFGALSSLIQEKPSNANYVSLTRCSVYEGDFNAFLKLKKISKEFEIIYNKLLEETYLRSEKKIDELCQLNATERYINLKEEIPDIVNLLPQYRIANYLNITPVQLSRIRKKMVSK